MAVVVTTLAHETGQWVRGRLALPLAKTDPQGIGSAITYGRRYALAAMVGVAPEDDDGNAAGRRTVGPAPKETPPTPVGGTPPPAQPKAPQATGKSKGQDGSPTEPQRRAITSIWAAPLGYGWKELFDLLTQNKKLTFAIASTLIDMGNEKNFDGAKFQELTGIISNSPPDEVAANA
jgi:hypothetical protein